MPAGATRRCSLRFPYREFPVTYFGDARPRPADVSTHRFAPGETVELVVRVFALDASRHAYAPVLRALHAEAAARAPESPWVDVATAADLTAEGLLTWHYDPDPGVLLETVGFDREVSGRDGLAVDRQAMHVGWVSGIPWAYALLAHGLRTGRPGRSGCGASRHRLHHRLPVALRHLLGRLVPRPRLDAELDRARSAASTPARSREATLFLVRAHALGAAARRDDQWDARHPLQPRRHRRPAARRRQPRLGAPRRDRRGAVVVGRVRAHLDRRPRRGRRPRRPVPARGAARRAATTSSSSTGEFIHGAPEDVDLAPTSEDGYAAVMAYVALHRATGDPHWLDVARRAADWMLTFRYSYDVRSPQHTLLGRVRFPHPRRGQRITRRISTCTPTGSSARPSCASCPPRSATRTMRSGPTRRWPASGSSSPARTATSTPTAGWSASATTRRRASSRKGCC